MKQRVTTFLLCMATVCIVFSGCNPEKMQAEESVPMLQVHEETPSASSEAEIPMTDQGQIDWNTAFRRDDLPYGELTPGSVAFLKRNDDGTESVVTVRADELGTKQPKRLPRTRYYEQFMEPAVVEELLPLLDSALFLDSYVFCVPTTRLTPDLIADAEPFLFPTYYDSYTFRAQGVRQFVQPGDDTTLFLLVSIESVRQVRDRYRRLDGMNMANAFVDNIPDGLDELSKMFRIYSWLTQTVQFYGGSSEAYFTKKSWCLLFDSMVMHIAVDAGYAETLSVICNLAGIECFTVKSPSHVWNIARIDGNWYCFDPACDRGLTPADFRYFGVSKETFRRLHGADVEEPLPFYREYGPDCSEDLFPLPFDDGADENTPAGKIALYCQFRNARNANPLFLFYRMDYQYDEIGKEAPQNGWIRTCVNADAFLNEMKTVMTEEQTERFTAGYFNVGTEKTAKLLYRVPADDPNLIRLMGLTDNGDGTWTADVLRFVSPTEWIPGSETFTMVQIGGVWFVDAVE